MNSDDLEIEKTIKSNFSRLKGVDFSEIIYNEKLDILNPADDLTSDIDGNWHFGVGSMPMIFKSVSNNNTKTELTKLLLINEISFDDKYNEKGNENIDFWDGDGFKIEKTLINEVNVIIITHANVTQKSFQTFNSTNLATPIPDSLDWIEGFKSVYDESSINSKDLYACVNVPFLFKDNLEYILIPISDNDLGKIIIDYLIVNNGGVDSYKQEDVSNNEDWEILFNGYGFNIGIYQEGNCIRIEKNISTKIHPLSTKIQSNIEGFGHQIFFKGDETIPDGKFTTEDIECLDANAFFDNIETPIKIFKNIVVEYNNNDRFLNIDDGSIVEIFNREPDGDIVFDIEGKCQIKLIKDKSYYKLNLSPPGGIYGSWDDLNQEEYNGPVPEVQFSYFSEEPVLKDYVMKEPKKEEKLEEKNEEERKQEKVNFLKKSTIPESDSNNGENNPPLTIWARLIKLIPWILLILIIYFLLNNNSCNTNQNYYQIGVDYFDEGNSEKGFEYLDKAIDQDNEHIDALMRRGREYMNDEEYQNAEYDFSEVIALDPNNWEAYYLRGRSYMGQAHNQYSPLYEKAIENFTKSIGLNSTSENSNSFYYRGEALEISQGLTSGCADFVKACNLELEEGCEKYDEICYPETGYMPYLKYFGEGVHSGNNILKFDNTNGKHDVLILVIDNRSKQKVRSQFIRIGDLLEMENIPSSIYKVKVYKGHDWTFEKVMEDNITRGGFTRDDKFQEVETLLILDGNYIEGLIFNPIDGGSIKSEDITESQFFD